MKRTLTVATLIALTLPLAGCLEDSEADVSACLLRYEDNQSTVASKVRLCMHAKGYDFPSGVKEPVSTYCWETVGSPKVGITPHYDFAKCYKQRGWFELFKRNIKSVPTSFLDL